MFVGNVEVKVRECSKSIKTTKRNKKPSIEKLNCKNHVFFSNLSFFIFSDFIVTDDMEAIFLQPATQSRRYFMIDFIMLE